MAVTLLLAVTACAPMGESPATPTASAPDSAAADTADTAGTDSGETDTAGADTADPIIDEDGDGWPPPADCDDLDATTYPGAFDSHYGGSSRDEDCNGQNGPLLAYARGGDTRSYGRVGDVDGDGVPDFSLGHEYIYHVSDWNVEVVSGGDVAEGQVASFAGISDAYGTGGAGDLDGDGFGELVTWRFSDADAGFDGGLCVFGGKDIVASAPDLGTCQRVIAPDAASVDISSELALLGDIDGDGVAEFRVDQFVLPTTKLLDPTFTVAQAPWQFPSIVFTASQTLASGDLDGDGLADLVAEDVAYLGATLGSGGIYYEADGLVLTGLAGLAGDVSGDGLDDVWLYDRTGTITIVAAPPPEVGPPHVVATISGTGDSQISGSIAGALGDLDGDGRGDFGIGVANLLDETDNPTLFREARLFSGATLAGAVLADDAERRIGYDAASFDHLDVTNDGVDDPILVDFDGDIGIMDGATVFP